MSTSNRGITTIFNGKPAKTRIKAATALAYLLAFLATGCSFDYGPAAEDNNDQPDIVMREVEYVRVRDGKPVVRFEAESAMRFESRQAMEITNFSFEQFDGEGVAINAIGKAGEASVELETGDIKMREGVSITVESEDLIILTPNLNWQDKERVLSSGEQDRVEIQRSDGTNFSGSDFSADARRRSWSFRAGVAGSYYHDDDDGKTNDELGE